MVKENNQQVLQHRQDPAALFLFDEASLPRKPEWVERVREKHRPVTGARLLDDKEKVQRMVDLLCLGHSVSAVSRALQVSRDTIRAARRVLVERGDARQFKETFVERAQEIIEEGADAVQRAIADGKMHPNFISSAVGIMFDKRALALGEPTSIGVSGTAKLPAESLSVAALNAWIAKLPAEGESSGNVAEPKPVAPVQSVDAGSDAGGPATAGVSQLRASGCGWTSECSNSRKK